MSAALQRTWTRDEFFDWAPDQNERDASDGLAAVPVMGGRAAGQAGTAGTPLPEVGITLPPAEMYPGIELGAP